MRSDWRSASNARHAGNASRTQGSVAREGWSGAGAGARRKRAEESGGEDTSAVRTNAAPRARPTRLAPSGATRSTSRNHSRRSSGADAAAATEGGAEASSAASGSRRRRSPGANESSDAAEGEVASAAEARRDGRRGKGGGRASRAGPGRWGLGHRFGANRGAPRGASGPVQREAGGAANAEADADAIATGRATKADEAERDRDWASARPRPRSANEERVSSASLRVIERTDHPPE